MNGLKRTKRNKQASRREAAINSYDPRMATPNELCDAVRGAIVAVPQDDRLAIKEKLLAALQGSKLNVGSILLLLGIHADTVDELTPSDVGYLVRYIRMNSPDVVVALKRPLAELFEMAGQAQRAQRLQETKRAA